MKSMATTSKRAPTPRAKRSSESSAAPTAAAVAPAEPFLRFYFSAALCKKTLALLTKIERARDPVEHRESLSDLIMELTNSGMDYYFMLPLKKTKAGFIIEQSASIGLTAVRQMMGSVVRQIIGRMQGPQLVSVSESIRQLMR